MGYFNFFKTTSYDINGDGIYDKIVDISNIAKVSDKLLDSVAFYNYVTVIGNERPDQLSTRLYGTPKYYWTFIMINPNISNVWNDWVKGNMQLNEYCTNKYKGLMASTDDDIIGKFQIGEQIEGGVSHASGIIREIHTNNKYIVFDVIGGTFIESGETIQGEGTATTSGSHINAMSIKSAAHAPYFHLDNSTGEAVSPRTAGTTPFTFYDYESMLNDENAQLKVIKPEHIASVVKEIKKEMGS